VCTSLQPEVKMGKGKGKKFKKPPDLPTVKQMIIDNRKKKEMINKNIDTDTESDEMVSGQETIANRNFANSGSDIGHS
jgi:hypothetical protein